MAGDFSVAVVVVRRAHVVRFSSLVMTTHLALSLMMWTWVFATFGAEGLPSNDAATQKGLLCSRVLCVNCLLATRYIFQVHTNTNVLVRVVHDEVHTATRVPQYTATSPF